MAVSPFFTNEVFSEPMPKATNRIGVSPRSLSWKKMALSTSAPTASAPVVSMVAPCG